jgi:hypothetical protein
VNDRDAIIFIGPLLWSPAKSSADAIGRRIAAALDRQALTGGARFDLSEGEEEAYDGVKTRVVTITRKDGQEHPVADIYDMGYRGVLIGEHKDNRPILQALAIFWLLLTNFSRLLAAYKRPSKNKSQKRQVAYAVCLSMGLTAYMLALLLTAVGTAFEVFSGEAWRWLRYPQAAVIFLTALGVFTTTDLKRVFSSLSTDWINAVNYLNVGSHGGALTGQLSSLLEHIANKKNKGLQYRRVHIIGYSFGSIIAIDSIFPYMVSDRPGERYRHIDMLVTIGCPFDFIRTYWEGYFEQRVAWEEAPRRWLNIFHPADVLASNFLDEGKSGSEERGVVLTTGAIRRPDSIRFGRNIDLGEYSWSDWLSLIGFQLHNVYWEDEYPYDVNCFDLVVEKLYEGDYALS